MSSYDFETGSISTHGDIGIIAFGSLSPSSFKAKVVETAKPPPAESPDIKDLEHSDAPSGPFFNIHLKAIFASSTAAGN